VVQFRGSSQPASPDVTAGRVQAIQAHEEAAFLEITPQLLSKTDVLWELFSVFFFLILIYFVFI
jgi:hypothetical protein